MADEGCTLTIDSDGKRYLLLPADCNRIADLNCDAVRSSAVRAAKRTTRCNSAVREKLKSEGLTLQVSFRRESFLERLR